jgi:3-dehydroquinate synthase
LSALSELRVRSSHGDYDVRMGSGLLYQATADAAIVVVDSAIAHLLPPGTAQVITVTADERTKTLSGVERLVISLRECGTRHGDLLLAVGGGVVQDLASFSAAVYMRGIDWLYAPTTLMSMSDSCIGGKSAINAGDVKNLVGNFHPPREVVIDPVFLGTLPAPAVSAGLAEAAKIAYCRGAPTFDQYLRLYGSFASRPIDLIAHVLEAKRWFVETDEHDQKERRLLNFGHTFGHALEVAVDHRVSHGLAVAVGMLCAVQHPAATRSPAAGALATHCRELLAVVSDLPDRLGELSWERYEAAFRSDKKHDDRNFRLILPVGTEGVAEVTVPAVPTEWSVVAATTEHVLRSVGWRA